MSFHASRWAVMIIALAPFTHAQAQTSPCNGDTVDPFPSVTLTWYDQGPGYSYEVQIAFDGYYTMGAGGSLISWVSGLNTPLLNSTICTYDTTYFWRIRSHFGDVWGDWAGQGCNFFTIAAPLNAPDQAPTATSPADGAHCVDPFSWLVWSPLGGILQYRVAVDTLPSFASADTTVVLSPFATLNSLFGGLLPGATCYWKVCAENALGTGTWSTPWSFTTYEDVTDSDGDGTADCSDGCPNDPNKIAPGICGCGVSDVDSDADLMPDCIDSCPFVPGGVGWTCDDGLYWTHNDSLNTMCECVGELIMGTIPAHGPSFSFDLSPNPAADQLTIRSRGEDGPVHFDLIDVSGRVVMSEETWLISGLPHTMRLGDAFARGSYSLRCIGARGSYAQRVMIR